jgi:hypothetical protein
MGNKSNLIMYRTEDGVTKIDVTFEEDTVWITQEQMAELFQKSKSTINEHIKNIYTDGELNQELTMKKFGNSEFYWRFMQPVLTMNQMQKSPYSFSKKCRIKSITQFMGKPPQK